MSTQRINIARPTAPSYSPDPHGFGNSRPASNAFRAQGNPDDPLDKLRTIASKIEDQAEVISQPLKPHLPAIGRFLIVVTFLEDALRMITQWGDQVWYLQKYVHNAIFIAA